MKRLTGLFCGTIVGFFLVGILMMTMLTACDRGTPEPFIDGPGGPESAPEEQAGNPSGQPSGGKKPSQNVDTSGMFQLRYSANHTPLDGTSIDMACAAGETLYYFQPVEEEEIVTLENGEQVSIVNFRQTLQCVQPDGTEKELEAFSDFLESAEDTGGYSIYRICAAPDGTLRVLARQYGGELSGGMRLLGLSAEGAVQFDTLLLCDPVQSWYRSQLCCDSEGWTYLRAQEGVLVVDGQGNMSGILSGEPPRYLSALADGRVVGVISQLEEDTWVLRVADAAKGSFSGRMLLPRPAEVPGICRFFPGTGDFDLYCATDLSLYGYRLGENGQIGTGELLLSWLNCDVEGAAIQALTGLSDGGFAGMTFSEAFGADQIVLTPQLIEPAEETVLTLACRELDSETAQLVLRYNRQDNGARIVVKDYGAVAVKAGLASGVDQLVVDLITGKAADLFCTQRIDAQTLIDQGLLEDLWPWIDGDSELGGREALVQPVFNAMSQNGKLYEITGHFSIRSMLGLAEVVGDTPGWTVEQFQQARASLPDCLSIMDPWVSSQQDALEEILSYCLEDFVDRQSWTASFDSPAFAAILEYAGAFPKEAGSMDEENERWAYDKRQLLVNGNIWDPTWLVENRYRNFGVKPATYIGWPGVKGNGSAFYAVSPLAMSSAGTQKEQAWSFLRTALLPETQRIPAIWGENNGVRGMPTNKAQYDAMIQRCLEPPENTTSSISDPYGNFLEIQVTQADADELWELISGITVVERTEENLAAIIRDEAARYFAGDQSAEAAAKAIQSRVNLYLGERKK